MLVQHNYPANSSIGNFKEPEQNMRLSTFPIVSFYSRPLNVHGFTACVTRFHCPSHGLTVGSSLLTVLQILSRFCPKLTVS